MLVWPETPPKGPLKLSIQSTSSIKLAIDFPVVNTQAFFQTDGFGKDDTTAAAIDTLDGGVFAMGDGAGSLGYFTEKSIIHLEGFVNNYECQALERASAGLSGQERGKLPRCL